MSDLHRALVLCLGLCSFLMINPGESLSQSSKNVTKGKQNAKTMVSGNEFPAGIHEYSSANFALRTDLSAVASNELLDRLEKMLVLVSKYYGKPNSQVIEMNVVNDNYGPMSKEISFEYLFFLKHMNQGYRSDLCAWDWKTKSQRLRGSATAQVKVVANRGWQTSRVMVKEGDKIWYTATGDWELRKGDPKVGPEGDENGRGRLEGVLFTDYRLSELFNLGSAGEYEAQADGNLFLRCRDDWCEIADNQGAVTVRFKTAP